MIIEGEKNVTWFLMKTQLSALKLEMMGLKSSRGSVFARVKRQYGLRGSRQSVYDQLFVIVEANRPT